MVASSVRGMLGVLGVDPFDPHWTAGGSSAREDRLTSAVDALVATLLPQRAEARAAKDFAAADAIRDQLKAAGIDLEDTPRARVDLDADPTAALSRAATCRGRTTQPKDI